MFPAHYCPALFFVNWYKIGIHCGYAIRSGRFPEKSVATRSRPSTSAADFSRDIRYRVTKKVFLLSSTNTKVKTSIVAPWNYKGQIRAMYWIKPYLVIKYDFIWNTIPGSKHSTCAPRQNGRHLPDEIFKCIFLNEMVWVSIAISLKLSLGVQLTIFQHLPRLQDNGQATSHYLKQWWLVYWRIYASLGFNEPMSFLTVCKRVILSGSSPIVHAFLNLNSYGKKSCMS